MTAAAGILHEEFHSHDFTRKGGRLEMVQLWVNLPAADKMATPGYQSITSADIPGGGTGRRCRQGAGDCRPVRRCQGPARTFTPMDVWDLRLDRDASTTLDFAEGHTVAMVVLHGTVLANDSQVAREGQMLLFDRAAGQVKLEANAEATVLVLAGEPIDEPIAGYGPFVMNTQEQIHQAIEDFNSGRFGQMPG
jgi:Pirin-related protein